MRLITLVFFISFAACSANTINVPKTCNIANKHGCVASAFCDKRGLQGIDCIIGLYHEAAIYEETADKLVLSSFPSNAQFEYRQSLTLLEAAKENLKNLLLADFNAFKYNYENHLMNKLESRLKAVGNKLNRCNNRGW